MFLLNNLKGIYLYPHIISNTSIAVSVSKVAMAAPFSAKKGIKEKLSRRLMNEAIAIDFSTILSLFLGNKMCIPITSDKPTIRIVGVVISTTATEFMKSLPQSVIVIM